MNWGSFYVNEKKISKKAINGSQKTIKREQVIESKRQAKAMEAAKWNDKNHWNFPNDFVALAFLAYNGLETTLTSEQIYELRTLMAENLPDHYYRSYWIYSCGYCATSLWDYDRENGSFRRKETATTLDLVKKVVESFDITQLKAVFPDEVVSILLSMRLEEDRKEKVFVKQ